MNQDLFNRLLNYYQIDEKEYQRITSPVSSETFASGHDFKHINEAIKLAKDIMDKKGKIFIYGDYDADGIMGTSILVKMFSILNYPVSYYIPSRYIDGYGLTLSKAKECVDNKIDLVICVDNGVSAIEEIKLLKENNIHVLVLDHHEIQNEIPNADYILHPTFDEFGQIPSSGAFTAFNFSRRFLGYFDKYLAVLAGISLISDMMPLKDYNRELLRIIFNEYQEGEFLQIDLLKEDEPFNEQTIGMKIAPKINSIGRLFTDRSPNKLIDYFVSNDKSLILNYIDWINDANEQRKNLSKEASENMLEFNTIDKAIVYICSYKEGLLGLIANNLLNKYRVPVLVMTVDKEKGIYKGSARAPVGFSIVDAFQSVKEYASACGGHALAGGCSVPIENIDKFTQGFKEYANTHPIETIEKERIELGLTEFNNDNYRLVQSFSPFGESWPSPEFIIKHISTRSLFFSRTGEHIFTQIGYSSRIVGFYFSMETVKKFSFIDAIGTMRSNTYRGNASIEYLIKEIRESK